MRSEPVAGARTRSGDRELVAFVARHGGVGIGHLMAALGIRQAWAYRRVARCIELGFLRRTRVIHDERSLICATRSGLRFVGLGALPVATVKPHAVEHYLRCASTAIALAEEFGPERVLSERELTYLEQGERRPIASAKVGTLPSGAPRLHRPDLVVLPEAHPLIGAIRTADPPWPAIASATVDSSDSRRPSSPRTQGGRGAERTEVRDRAARTEDTGMRSVSEGLIAVEVELSGKSPRRLETIVRGWRRADWVGEVRYYCAPGFVTRGVERAVQKLHVADRVRVLEVVAR
jgi:hypothetical protein